jgi:hypothetical protein
VAEVVDELPPKDSAKPKGSKWDRYLDGQVWRLEPGVDHDGTAQRLALVLRKHGGKRNLSVAIRFKDGFVYVQAAPRD